MNRPALAIAACASLALLAACGQAEQQAAVDQQNEAIDQAQDAASAVVGPTAAATIGSTTVDGFVMEAANGDMYEIESAKLALQRSQNAEVKKLAQAVIDDHTASSAKLKTLISSGEVADATLPAVMDERHQGLIDNLRGAAAEDFDNRFLDQQANVHREALILLNGYQTVGQNESLKAFAAEVKPKVEAHLDMISKLDRGGAADATVSTTAR